MLAVIYDNWICTPYLGGAVLVFEMEILNLNKGEGIMGICLRSLYICVHDMDRALRFYEGFFERPAIVRDEVYSVFDLHGFRFGLFAYGKVGETHVFGSNCLPSIELDSLNKLKEKTDSMEKCFPLTKIGTNWVLEILDSEGNHIEVTAPVQD